MMPPEPSHNDYMIAAKNSEGVMTQVEDADKKKVVMELWGYEKKSAMKEYKQYKNDLEGLFITIIGQLDRGIRDSLKSDEKWCDINSRNDTIELLKLLQELCYRENTTKVSAPLDLLRKMRRLINSKQDSGKDTSAYVDEVTKKFDVLKAAGGSLISKQLISYVMKKYHRTEDYEQMNEAQQTAIQRKAEQVMVAMIIIDGSNDKTYRNISRELADQFTVGMDNYPATAHAAQEMLNQYKMSRGGSNGSAGTGRGGNRQQQDRKHDERGTDRNNDDKSESEGASLTTIGEEKPKSEAHQLLLNGSANDTHDDDGFCFAQFGMVHEKSIDQEESTCMDNAYNFSQRNNGFINPFWLLLDSQATCNVICNPKLVTNIREHPRGRTMTIFCNAGKVTISTIATMHGFGEVWYHERGIANCLSLALVSDSCRVTLDTNITQAFFVHKDDGSVRRFDRMDCNLYASDVSLDQEGTVLAITTVEGQKRKYSDLDVRRATAARKLQDTMGYPSLKAFLRMIDNNMILNCHVTRRDVMMAEDIFGANVSIIKGKSVRRQPGHVREDLEHVPPDILKNYGNVTLSIDIYHINGIKFFRAISRHIMFRSVRCIRDAKRSTIVECIRALYGAYSSRGFTITKLFGDNEFNCIAEDVSAEFKIQFHPVARGQHEPFIERDNRTSKERVRCTFNATPFKMMPKRMVIEMVIGTHFWLNSWCSSGGISKTVPPQQIMTGVKLDATKHCKFQFGDYVLSHNETDNTMKPRANDAIYLRPSGSASAGFFVFDLTTGRRVHRKAATLAHMTNSIIDKVHAIAKSEKAPIGLIFGDFNNESTILDIDPEQRSGEDDDDASDDTYEPDETSVQTELTGVETEESDDDDEVSIPHTMTTKSGDHTVTHSDGNSQSQADTGGSNDDAEETTDDDDDTATVYPEDDEDSIAETDARADDEDHTTEENPDGDQSEATEHEIEFEAESDVESTSHEIMIDHPTHQDTPDAATRKSRRLANLSPTKIEGEVHRELRPYNADGPGHHFFTAGFEKAVAQIEREHHAVVLVGAAMSAFTEMDASQVTPQYGVQKGIKMFGEDGVDAILKELKQLHELRVISPVKPSSLTREEIKRALPYLMFLKRKRCGKIKGRGCADGRRQREFITKEEASSPTVNLHALFITCLIDALEHRYVATVDIPGAFLQTPMPEDEDPVHIRIAGKMAELLALEFPDVYKDYLIWTRTGTAVLYTVANKAIYGTLKAALLFWESLSGKLQEWGFELNPYDRCTANKIINGKQATIVWHVDDLKISHVEASVVNEIIDKLRSEFGKTAPLSVNEGKVHEYLGMVIDYSTADKVTFQMFDYVEDIIATLPDSLRVNRHVPTPAASHLFEVNPEAEKLRAKDADTFHRIVAKLLFAAKRARPDLQTAVAFLCTRVQSPDVDDWKKLARCLGYLRDTVFLPLTIGSDGTGNMYWYVDASFAVHHNMRSHTGAILTFGHGAAISLSTKQKINTKSSTEAELVGVDDALPHNIWCLYFLRAQGYHAQGGNNPELKYLGHTNVLYQDNTSSIRLENNGKASSTKRTRHINIRYFLITDKVKQGEVSISYCPTEEMLADYFTKPLQGSLFIRFRNAILGVSDADYLRYKSKFEELKRSRSKAPD